MRWRLPLSLIFAACLLSGCERGNVELIEARLRTREDALHTLNTELAHTQQYLARSERERDLLQQQLASSGGNRLHAEVSRSLARIEGLNIDSRLTGMLNSQDGPTSRELNLLFSPVDGNADPVKLEGRTIIELYDFSAPATQHKRHAWEFTPQETAAMWHSGFIGEGFQFTLPVPAETENESLLINVSFETPDGRRFRATHELAASAKSSPTELGTNEPPPLPLSDKFELNLTQPIIPASHSREWEDLPPATAKSFPFEPLFDPK
jgi:hypothetical protein